MGKVKRIPTAGIGYAVQAVERSQPSEDGTLSSDQRLHHERVAAAVTKAVQDAVRRVGTQRSAAKLLNEWGWPGRGGGPIAESTLSGWHTGRNTPTARELVALALLTGVSLDEYVHGAGLRAEVDELREAQARNARDIEGLRDMLTGMMSSGAAGAGSSRRSDPAAG